MFYLIARCALLSLAFVLTLIGPAAQAQTYETYTPYQGQVSCDPTAKPGTVAFSRLIMGRYGGGSSGIVRACGVGGLSEHKEGRAWDWRMNANNAHDRRQVNRALQWLTAPINGQEAARAYRLGIMYVIWDRKMWRAYDVDRGWAPYDGSSAHRDHVHFSLSWSGARKLTSWWTENPVYDYGPCPKWINEMAPRAKGVRLEPCPQPLRRPSYNEDGMYEAQAGESLARLARWFERPEARIRRWNGWPADGWVSIVPGSWVRVRGEV